MASRAKSSRTDAPGAVLAAIDVGTNTTRLLVARVADGALTVLARGAAMTELGQGLSPGGTIRSERLSLVEATVREMSAEARALGAEEVAVACTAAARMAENSEDLLVRLRQASGTTPRIVSGDDEAALTARGIIAAGAPDPLLAVDLGGGSCEIAHASDGRIDWAVSLDTGTRRVTERFRLPDPPPLDVADAMVALALTDIDAVARSHDTAPAGAVVTGGSAAALRVLAETETLDGRALLDALERLAAAPAASIADETGLDPARVAQCFAGAAILEAVRRAFDVTALVVSEAGLREGMLLELAAG